MTAATSNSNNPNSGTDNDNNGVDISSHSGFVRSNNITLEYGGGSHNESDHGVDIGGITEPTLDRNADYTVDFGFIEGTAPAASDVGLSITKTASTTAANSGDSISYTIIITNSGTTEATNIQVRDQLPTGVTYTGSSATSGSYDQGTGIWLIPSLAGGGAVATLTIDVTVD